MKIVEGIGKVFERNLLSMAQGLIDGGNRGNDRPVNGFRTVDNNALGV